MMDPYVAAIGAIVLVAIIVTLMAAVTALFTRTNKMRVRLNDMEDSVKWFREKHYALDEELRQTRMKLNAFGKVMGYEWHEPPEPLQPVAHWRKKETT